MVKLYNYKTMRMRPTKTNFKISLKLKKIL